MLSHGRGVVSRILLGVSLLVGMPFMALGQTVGESVYKRVAPSVVTVTAGDSTGTGFLVRDKRTFITAAHVIANGEVPVVRFGKGSFLSVRSIAISKELDIAILQTEDEVGAVPLVLGDRDELNPGAQVFAIGSALGALSHTLTDGMISGARKAGPVDLIQVTSPFSPGMSGGPVLSKDARVLGVISFSFSEGQNLNMAVAARHVRQLLGEQARPTDVVIAELKQTAKSPTSASPAGTSTPTSPPKDDPQEAERKREAREQALADLLTEVNRWTNSARNDCYRLYYDSTIMEDWQTIHRAVEAAQKRLPLLLIDGKFHEVDITSRIVDFCNDTDFDQLSKAVLRISHAMGDLVGAYSNAVIDLRSRITAHAEVKRSFQLAVDFDTRLGELQKDFSFLIVRLYGRGDAFSRVKPIIFGSSGAHLGVHADYERPELAAVRWKLPNRKTEFRVGDVITGLRLASDSEFTSVTSWKDVNSFIRSIRGSADVVVRVRGGRSFILRDIKAP